MKSDWKNKATIYLDRLERGAAQPMTKDQFATYLGINRQTLWRNSAIRDRLNDAIAGASLGRKRVIREGLEMRVRRLEARIVGLERENGNLIQNLVIICKNLRDNGLDPLKYMGELAADSEKARHLTLTTEE